MAKLIAYGDSIFAGWDGKENLPEDKRIPQMVGKAMGWQVTNTAISGAQFNDSDSGFPAMTKKYSAAGYDYALVNFGVNNWCFPSGDLSYVESRAKAGIDTLKAENPHLKILLELPTEDFRNGSTTLFDINAKGWSQYQLDNLLVKVAQDEGIDYYDWRPDPLITYDNANQTLGDGNTGVHPTYETGQKIAARLAAKFKSMIGNSQSVIPVEPATPSQPNTPTSKPKPVIDKLSINRLNDLFKIGDNIDQGINTTFAKINALYKQLARVEGLAPLAVKASCTNPGNALDRPLRNYVILSFRDIERPINDLVSKFNRYWIRNPKTANPTESLTLMRPDRLTVDSSYQAVINTNWKKIESKINELISYINHMLEGND